MRHRGIVTLLAAALLLAGCVGPSLDAAAREDAPEGDGVFSGTSVVAGKHSTKAHRLLERGPFTDLLQEVTLLPSALDGADIQIYVMRPDTDARVPVIADAGPYFPPLEGVDLSGADMIVDFVSRGFAFALVSVRGTGNSGGCMDLMGHAERHDIDQAITWLGTQPWSNGNVGMFGGSYDGSTQWEAASTGNPHLKTIAPIAAIPDLFSFMHRNGTAMAWTPAQFGAIYWAFYGPVLYNPTNGRSVDNTAGQLVCPESTKGMAVSVPSALVTSERDPLGWWAARDWRDDVLANYTGSIYLIHGFNDVTVEPHTAYPFVNELEAKGLVVKHTLGPWGHELPWRADSLEILARWYDRWLNDNASADIGPKVQVMDNLGLWRDERAWPPADATPTTFHLAAGGALAREPGGAAEPLPVAPLVPVHDHTLLSRFNAFWKLYEDPAYEACPACPTFETEPLAEELRFAGSPKVHVTVTPTGPGGHVTAILYAVDADGKAQRVGMGMMDLR
ncbi:MAG TPA: CocE/NonD family hydrolase, partial [Candidatus Thermoplasmatota archaeon]|nr:CocE/NonD family hydrolase [Candidatus Thermoplasmatota archaeon]